MEHPIHALEEFAGTAMVVRHNHWSNYETMAQEKVGKDLTPHRVKYRTLKR